MWSEEKQLNIKLQDKLQNPVDYKITAVFKEVEFSFDSYILKSDEFYNSIDNKLLKIDNILSIERNTNSNSLSYLISELSYHTSKMSKSDEYYKKELLEYKDELIKFKDNINTINNNMKQNINNEISKIYSVSLAIENVGRKSDSDINIKIVSDNKIFNKFDIGDIIYKHRIDYPIEPKAPKAIESFSVSPNNFYDNHLNSFNNFNIPNAYRQDESIEEHRICTTLRDMNVGDKVLVVEDILYMMKEDDFKMSYIIKSKESEKIIEKNIEICYDDKKLIYNKTEEE